jgi:hypothetical protein
MRPIIFLLGLLLAAGPPGCGPDGGDAGQPPGRGQALVVTSDYQDGSFALIDTETLDAWTSPLVFHPDAVCRYDPLTRSPFMISRLGADAVAVLDPEQGWTVAAEYTVGSGSNPQDIAVVAPDRAYVLRYAEPEALVVHPQTGAVQGRVDLGAYADADGVPEMAYGLVHGGRVYVALQRLVDFAPGDYSSLLVLDGAGGTVEREIRLTASDPFAPLRHVPALDAISVPEVGLFGELDGGVELLAPDAAGPAGLAVTEAELGGDLVDALVVDATRGYAVIAVADGGGQHTELVRFDPSSGRRQATLLAAAGFDYSFMALSPDRRQLWLTDRTRSAPGVRVFSVADDRQLTAEPIATGLPPFMICFVPAD